MKIFKVANNESMSCTCSSRLQSASNQVDKGLRKKNNIPFPKYCVENDIEIIMNWFRANSLTLNIQKTKYLLFTPKKGKKNLHLNIGMCCIKPDTETKFLGVILDDKLTWNSQVKNVLIKMKWNL